MYITRTFLTRMLSGTRYHSALPDEGEGGGGGGEFAFDQQVEDLATVPKQYQGLYAKNADGKYALDAAVAKRIVDPIPLRSALDKERKLSKEATKAVNAWKQLGDDPAEIAAKLQRLQALEEKAGDGDQGSKNALAKIKQETEANINAIKSEYESKIKDMGESLATHLIEKEAISALASAKGSPELLTRLVTDSCLLVKEDGKYVVRVVDSEGDPRSDGRGGFLTIEGLVAEMKANPKYARAFESSGRSGGGMPQGSGTGKGSTNEKLTAQQKIERGLNALQR